MSLRVAILGPILGCCLMAACTQFPQLDAVEEDVSDAPFPRLLPLEQLTTAPPLNATPQMADSVVARAQALRQRAQVLAQRDVVDAATKRRMARGVQ